MNKTGIIILTAVLFYIAFCLYLRLQRFKAMNSCCKLTGKPVHEQWSGSMYRMLLWEPFMEPSYCDQSPYVYGTASDCCETGFPANTADGVNYIYCKRGDKYYVSGIGGIGGTIAEKETTKEKYESACKNKTA